jgi:hypothetical protein
MTVVPSWVEAHCVVPDGFRKGAPFQLYDYQLQYYGSFYSVRGDAAWDPAAPLLASAFVFRRGLLIGPQKVGKNPLIASQVCVEGVGPAVFAGWASSNDGYACREHGCHCGWEYPYEPGEPMGMSWPTPLIQITAFSQESTDNTYDSLRPMIEGGPLSDVVPKTGEEFIRLPGGGRIDTVTSSAQSRLGNLTTFVSQDEVGIWTAQNKMARLADTQYRGLAGMGGRASLTSNACDPAEKSVAQVHFESEAKDIYLQFIRPPAALSYSDRRERHKIHETVYPADTRRENGGHLDLASIENEAADLVERDLAQAMRFYGNILVAGAGVAVDPDRWDELGHPERGKPAAGTRIGGGFDGSISQDSTFIRGCTTEGYSFIHDSWIKPVGPELNRWLAAHPGKESWEVDRLEVDQSISEFFTKYDVGLMLCDTPKWRTEIENWALRYGKEVVLAFDTNQARRFAPATDRWLTGISTGAHTHDADPETDDQVKAAHKQKVRLADAEDDGRTLYVLVKGSDKRRIDGAVTDVLAYQAAMTLPAPPEAMGPPMFAFR